jgi:hypothetical protein
MIDIAVAYRRYPGISKTPAYFSDDKFRLSKMCLNSFKMAFGGLRFKIWALLGAARLNTRRCSERHLKAMNLRLYF